jgi:hypothetical protein
MLINLPFFQVSLGTAATYGALAVRGVVSTGSTVVNGDVGTTGQAISGFPPGVFTGTSEDATAAATQARADALSAYNTAVGLTSSATLATELSGNILGPGVYKITKTATLSGPIFLDGSGTFVFQIASTLTTTPAAEVVLTDGALPSDIIWAVGAAATFGANSTFAGTVISQGLISVGAGATFEGGLFSGSSITLDANVITV